jgi:hypothetical protein
VQQVKVRWGGHAFDFQSIVSKKWAVFVGKGNCASRKLVASRTPTRSLSSWQIPERLAKPRKSEAQGKEDLQAGIQNTSSDRGCS